jgi:uncharacterized coiled-coil DUF342 family protein
MMKFFERRQQAAAEAQGAALAKYRAAVHRAAKVEDLPDAQGQALIAAALAAGFVEADVAGHVEAVRAAQRLAEIAGKYDSLVQAMKDARSKADGLRRDQQEAAERFGRLIGEAEDARAAAVTAADEASTASKELEALRARYPQLFE